MLNRIWDASRGWPAAAFVTKRCWHLVLRVDEVLRPVGIYVAHLGGERSYPDETEKQRYRRCRSHHTVPPSRPAPVAPARPFCCTATRERVCSGYTRNASYNQRPTPALSEPARGTPCRDATWWCRLSFSRPAFSVGELPDAGIGSRGPDPDAPLLLSHGPRCTMSQALYCRRAMWPKVAASSSPLRQKADTRRV